MKIYIYFIFTLFSISFCAQSHGQNNKYSFGNGFTFSSPKHFLKIAGRAQVLATSIFEMDTVINHTASNLFVRRARVKINSSHFDDLIKTKFEFGLSPRDLSIPNGIHYTFLDRLVLDAYLVFNPFDGFDILIGQHKLPGNRQRVVSSGNMELVDRSILNSKMTLDRDFGIQICYEWPTKNDFVTNTTFALSQGEGKNIIMGNRGGLNYTFRSEILPFGQFSDKGDYIESAITRESSPKLSIGATYDFNNDVFRTRGQKGSLIQSSNEMIRLQTDIHTLFIDAMFKWKGLSFLSEFGHRTWINNDNSICGKAYSVHFQPGYTFKNNWNIALRYANYNEQVYEGNHTKINEYRLGISKYIIGHKLKIQSDFGVMQVNSTNNLVGRIQFEFHM